MHNFEGHYINWRDTRIKKIVDIMGGEDYFKGKTLLELACGYGDTGAYFSSIGAVVTLAEGRKQHVDVIKNRHKDLEVIHLDQNYEWNLNRNFDIIIHMGVLYHLENWKQDLGCALKHTNTMILETEVANRSAADFEVTIKENSQKYDQAIHGAGTRASAACIENEIEKLGFGYTRYDDADLNSDDHCYDWVVDDNGPEWRPARYRRFWRIDR